MIAALQNFGDSPSPEIGWAGVMRSVEQGFRETLIDSGGLIAEDPGEQPGHCVDQQSSREFAAAQDKITYRNLFVDQVGGNAFVDPFVPATDKQQFRNPAEPAGGLLGEQRSLGRHQDNLPIMTLFSENCFGGVKDRFGFEQHSLAAAEGTVVDGAMAVIGPLAEVMGMEFEQSGGGGFGDDAVVKGTAEEIRKDGENVELHGAAALVAVQLEQTVGQGGPDEPVGWIDDGADGPGEGDERTGFELNEIGAGHFEGGCDDAQRGAG